MDGSGKRPLPADQENNSRVSKKRQGDEHKEHNSTSHNEDAVWQVFNDPVHGFIELHPLLVKIINTLQFQRLKDIKQLGVCYWVFPGASHNRFEHSLGTAYLCGKMIDRLQELHRGEFEITDKETLCVKIAGLCHDLGHGPFSHFFDGVYIPHVQKERKKFQQNLGDGSERSREQEMMEGWSHEDASCALFDLMIRENPELKKAFDSYDIDEDDRSFIKELIQGKDPTNENEKIRVCSISGKPKWFLYEIVSNKRNGIDCDKFDYFARDCFNVGVKSNFDSRRYFQNIRIIPVDIQLQICVRDKEVFNLYELFHTRWSLHHRVYQHKTLAPIEHLLTEALLKVDKKLKISSAISDVARYARLTDSIIYDILRNESDDEDIKEAQKLIERIQRRKLYKFCGQTQQLPAMKNIGGDAHVHTTNAGNIIQTPPSQNRQATLVDQQHDISQDDQNVKLAPGPTEQDIAEEMSLLSQGTLNADQIFVKVINIHFGMKHKDPVDAVVFFNKAHQPLKVRKNQVSQVLPSMFHERYFRVYAKQVEHTEMVEKCFQTWCQENNYTVPRMLDGDRTGYFSPAFKNTPPGNQHVFGRQFSRNLEPAFDEIGNNTH